MSQTIAYRESTFRVDRNSDQPVPTYLVCSNTLLRSGFDHILTGTQFSLSPEQFNDHADISGIDGANPVLLLLCESASASEPALEGLKAKWPSARVVIFADHLEPAALIRAFRAGIDGVCAMNMDRGVLLKALELVMLGERFIPASMGLALLSRNPEELRLLGGDNIVSLRADGDANHRLSGRERQILRCLIDGASNKHIARQLGVAEATVKVHVKAILRKAKVSNRTQAAMWAQRQLGQELDIGQE